MFFSDVERDYHRTAASIRAQNEGQIVVMLREMRAQPYERISKYGVPKPRRRITAVDYSTRTPQRPKRVVRRASASAPASAAAGLPTFEGVAYSGGVVPGHTAHPKPLPLPYVIDLAGMTTAKNIIVNLDHKGTQRVGHLIVADISSGRGLFVRGVLSAATKHRDEVRDSAADGMPWEVSLEANLAKPELVDEGFEIYVNKQTFFGPLIVFRRSKLTGLGFVSRGADEGNTVSIAASALGVSRINFFNVKGS